MQTATAYRPETLPAEPPPPRSAGVPGISIDAAPQADSNLSRGLSNAGSSALPLGNDARAQRESKQSDLAETASSTPSQASSTAAPSTVPKGQTRGKLRPRKAAMSLTPTAVDHLRQLLNQPDPKFIRVGVRNRGCSGLAYHLEYVDKPGSFDETVEQDGVKVLVDSKALFSIIGSEMDWAEDKLSSRFVFRNPNIKEQCGCGESFMV
ncbi:MAG: Iron-sulfur assembly protein 1 [Lichina confinis]|nr:MAG: Iron-sulfur assembly protein 1 [Lichina confinis]